MKSAAPATPPHEIRIPELEKKKFVLRPVHRAATAADKRIAQSASYIALDGDFVIPARSAVVFVVQ